MQVERWIPAFAGMTEFRMARVVKAVGERGSWFARVGEDRLPCVHRHWLSGATKHADPGYIAGDAKWDELVAAIKAGRKVVLTNDNPIPAPDKKSGLGFERTGYIAVFEVDNVVADDDGLRFDLTRRVQELR